MAPLSKIAVNPLYPVYGSNSILGGIMDNFKWCFNNFITELETNAFRDFIKTDREYKEIEHYLNKHNESFKKILNKLSDEDKKFTKEYIDKQTYQASCSSNSMYAAGYKDCVRLLKQLEVF